MTRFQKNRPGFSPSAAGASHLIPAHARTHPADMLPIARIRESLRHPDAVTKCVAFSGAFDNRSFLNGYFDDLAYFHNPVDYVAGNNDAWYHGHYHGDWFMILAASNHDICLGDNYRMAELLGRKQIPHRLDVWDNNMPHDWPLWRLMARTYFA